MKANKVIRVNGLFQQWQSLLSNRTKRRHSGKFIIQGVRPINTAISQQVDIDSILYKADDISDWAKGIIQNNDTAKKYELTSELMNVLGDKTEDTPELLLIAKIPKLELKSLQLTKLRSQFILVLDRPQSPGNIGAVVRSADALGAALVVISGHSADIYDPKSVRASRGSLFALPIVEVDGPSDIQQWVARQQEKIAIVGLTENSNKNLWDHDLQQPMIAVIGNETWGLSKLWEETCTDTALIPMQGAASSLNAASSAAIVMYEYTRQIRVTP